MKKDIKKDKNKIKTQEVGGKEIVTATSKAGFKDAKEKLHIPVWKSIYHGWFFWRFLAKAKKMQKVIPTDPGRYTEQYRYTWLKKKVAKIVRILNIRIEVFGVDNWLDEGLILAPNHKSNFDPLLMYNINDFDTQQPISFIAKSEIYKSKMGRFADIIDTVPLDRNNPRSAHLAFNAAKSLIVEYKRAMTVFPEGTRYIDDEIHEFIPTALKLAHMAHATVVPVSIIGTNQLSIKKRGKKTIKVVFGKPILRDKHIVMKPETLASITQRTVTENYNKYKELDTSSLNVTRRNKKGRIYYYDSI